MRRTLAAVFLLVLTQGAGAQPVSGVLEATTVTGEKVLLHANGRWEYMDAKKAAEAKQFADRFPENRVRPIDAQGGWLGTRTIMPGDTDYNRGTLNPKMR